MSKKKAESRVNRLITCAFCGEPVDLSECFQIYTGGDTEVLHRRCVKGCMIMRRAGASAGK